MTCTFNLSDSVAAMSAFKSALQEAEQNPVWVAGRVKECHGWSPYSMEGGSVFLLF